MSYAVGLVEGNNVADNSTADVLSDILPVPAARVRDAVGVPRASCPCRGMARMAMAQDSTLSDPTTMGVGTTSCQE